MTHIDTLAVRALFCLLALTAPAAAQEVRSLKLATGELLVHAFRGGVPLPAESKWATCQGAGPSFRPEGKQHRISWDLVLKPKGTPAQLKEIVRVTLQEVAGPTAVDLFDGPPKMANDRLVIIAPAHVVSRENYPWLYSAEPTLLVFRVILFKAAQQDKLVQPVLIGTGVKQQLKDSGYLP